MQSENNVNPIKRADNTRNTVISVKVSKAEKEELQEIADNLEMSLSEFMRLKSLSMENRVVDYERKIKDLEEEIKKNKVTLSYYNLSRPSTSAVILPMSENQKKILFALFDNFFGDNKNVEHQIIRYLAEDLITTHYNLAKVKFADREYDVDDIYIPLCYETPACKGQGTVKFFEAFQEFGLTSYRGYNQVKDESTAVYRKDIKKQE